ncbi:Hsp20/alpha crystallin family protein [Sphingobacterium sp. MYb382]|uniref:Hsp20/alpha crystallin family protein n=1 Tax=Sphingobacterium sp. MYb382 TaxID=2745278 RepID=UPI0030A0EDDD
MAFVTFPNRSIHTHRVNPNANNFFDSFFDDSFVKDRFTSAVPAVNISENDAAYLIELAAPGLQKSDFNIQVDKDLLTISVEKKEEEAAVVKHFSKREFNFSAFNRSFTLPESVDYNNIDAVYTDGVLVVTVGKKEESKIAKRVLDVK